MKKDHEKSSGNVFADLGLPDSEQELLKAKLTVEIYRLIKNLQRPGHLQTDQGLANAVEDRGDDFQGVHGRSPWCARRWPTAW